MGQPQVFEEDLDDSYEPSAAGAWAWASAARGTVNSSWPPATAGAGRRARLYAARPGSSPAPTQPQHCLSALQR